LGPALIRPPELESDVIEITDFRPSDVYLFAKTVWMIIKEDPISFRGEYRRDEKLHYLKSKDYDVETFEPLHIMLEGATKNDMSERITLDTCVNLLVQQLDVIEGNCSKLKELVKSEKSNEIKTQIRPNEFIFTENQKILEILIKLEVIFNISIDGINIISIRNISFLKEHLYKFSSDKNTYLINIGQIKINENNDYEIVTNTIDKSLYLQYVPIKQYFKSQFNNMNNKIIIDEKITIIVY